MWGNWVLKLRCDFHSRIGNRVCVLCFLHLALNLLESTLQLDAALLPYARGADFLLLRIFFLIVESNNINDKTLVK